MGLIKCGNCGETVSAAAKECPLCQQPLKPWYSIGRFTGCLLIFIAAAVLMAIIIPYLVKME